MAKNASELRHQRRSARGSWSFSGFVVRNTAMRHILIILAAVLLVALAGVVHQQWNPMHRWNKATADAAIVLLSMTMALGPLVKLWPAWGRILPFRRELGIHAVLLSLVHTVIILEGWVEWDLARLVGFEFHPGLGQYVMVQHGFALANVIGVLALAYGMILVSTSNDRAVRFLGGPVWKFVQRGVYVLWALVVVHTTYFLFMHFLDFHRPLPPPNPLRWPFVALVLLILSLRCAASVQSWSLRQRTSGAAKTAMSSDAAMVEATATRDRL